MYSLRARRATTLTVVSFSPPLPSRADTIISRNRGQELTFSMTYVIVEWEAAIHPAGTKIGTRVEVRQAGARHCRVPAVTPQ
jgi:hypothetical protein